MNDGSMEELHNPADMPDVVKIDHIDEPWIRAPILVPDDYMGFRETADLRAEVHAISRMLKRAEG